MFICILCSQPYVGRTTNQFNVRTNKHRSAYYKLLKEFKNNAQNLHEHFKFDNDDDDIYSLGIHLCSEHGCTNETDFNKYYRVLILETVSPKQMEVKEHLWIHKTKSLWPLGINRSNPFSIPLLSI